jgi:hypothetical protein
VSGFFAQANLRSARMKLRLLAVCLAALITICEGSALGQWWNPHNWPFTLIPIPEVATDPKSGTTYGILPVFLFTNERKEIRNIIAPDFTNNTILGLGGTFRYLAYPSSDTQYYITAGASEKIQRRVDAFYSTGRQRKDWWSFEGRLFFERDPTERFFGLGNNSRPSKETNYATEQVYAEGSIGLNITPELQIALSGRPRRVRILHGALKKLPFIGKEFPELRHLDGGTDVRGRLLITYDTRDSVDIPTSGSLFRVFGALADRRFLSSVSYTQFGAEARHFQQLWGPRFILAGHAYIQYTPADAEAPFWAMSRLGGQESILEEQQTLRGWGSGRFISNNLSVVNLELRARVYELNIFDTHGIIEVAPFVEAGRVFRDPHTNPVSHLHPVGGLGIRGIAEPFVVGFVDIGYGRDGTAIFSGINYPF